MIKILLTQYFFQILYHTCNVFLNEPALGINKPAVLLIKGKYFLPSAKLPRRYFIIMKFHHEIKNIIIFLTKKLTLAIRLTLKLTLTLKKNTNPIQKRRKKERQTYLTSGWQMETSADIWYHTWHHTYNMATVFGAFRRHVFGRKCAPSQASCRSIFTSKLCGRHSLKDKVAEEEECSNTLDTSSSPCLTFVNKNPRNPEYFGYNKQRGYSTQYKKRNFFKRWNSFFKIGQVIHSNFYKNRHCKILKFIL